jgi:hypothetical protein
MSPPITTNHMTCRCVGCRLEASAYRYKRFVDVIVEKLPKAQVLQYKYNTLQT